MTVAGASAARLDHPTDRLLSWARLLWLVAALPVVAVTGRALARGWMPMGDNAFFSIRASDVLTEHHPMLGAWSSGSLAVGVNVNNLGPLQLDLLALPVKVDWAAGTAVGVAAVNVGAILLACTVAARAGGVLTSLVVAAGAAGLCWSLGELLYEPRQHHALVLPFFAYVVLVWCLAGGHVRALPWAVLAGSFVLQTHLSYVVLVPVLGLFAVVALGLRLRRDRADGAVDWPARRREGTRSGLIAVAVAALCWVQPVLDQLFGRGNLSSIARAGQVEQDTAGFSHGARAVATVLGDPPWWFPQSFRSFDPQVTVVGGGAAALLLSGALLVLLAVGALAWRRGDRCGIAAVATSGVALAGALLAAASQTAEPPFGLVAGNYRWLWAISAFVWVSVLLVLVRALAASVRAQRGVVLAAGLAIGALATLAVVRPPTLSVVQHDERLMPVARDVLAQLGPLEGRGPLLVQRTDLFFQEPYTYVLMAGLQDRGIDWRVGSDDRLRYGDRRARTDDLAGVVRLATGDAALEASAAEERIAFATRFSEQEQRDLMELRAEQAPTAEEAARLDELEGRWFRETVAVLYEPVRDGS